MSTADSCVVQETVNRESCPIFITLELTVRVFLVWFTDRKLVFRLVFEVDGSNPDNPIRLITFLSILKNSPRPVSVNNRLILSWN